MSIPNEVAVLEEAGPVLNAEPLDRFLFLGPLPPPVGGYVVLFDAFLRAWAERAGHFPEVVDTSPKRIKSEPGAGVRDIWRGVRIAFGLLRAAKKGRTVVVLATTGLYLYLLPLLRWLHRRRRLRLIAWFSGGVLHKDIERIAPARRARLIAGLQSADLVMVETDQVRAGLSELGMRHVIALPNPRLINWPALPEPAFEGETGSLRVVYFSRVIEQKGVFTLINAVAEANRKGRNVQCDIYGPIEPRDVERFEAANARVSAVSYRGVVKQDILNLLASYDALVLPTWFPREGHPGALVEAMAAGIPVVTTRHMAIPEIIADGENGILVAPKSQDELCRAFCRLADDRRLLQEYGKANRARLHRHDARESVQRLADALTDITSSYS